MLKISRAADLGLLLMTELYLKKFLSLSDWAEEKKLPYRFLSQVASKLKAAGLISSREGRSGGYYLRGRPTVGKIFKAIDGQKGLVACLRGEKCKADKYCQQKKVLVRLNEIMEKELNRFSLDQLCR